MDEKEYKAIRARIGYIDYLASLPRCDKCSECLTFQGRKAKMRVCTIEKILIDGRITTSPEWCPKRGSDGRI